MSAASRSTSSAVPPGTCLIHGSFVGALCPTCSTAATVPGLNQYAPVRLDDHKPLASVGLVCTCGKALASMELAARACSCGRVWLISVSQIGGPQ